MSDEKKAIFWQQMIGVKLYEFVQDISIEAHRGCDFGCHQRVKAKVLPNNPNVRELESSAIIEVQKQTKLEL